MTPVMHKDIIEKLHDLRLNLQAKDKLKNLEKVLITKAEENELQDFLVRTGVLQKGEKVKYPCYLFGILLERE